MKKLLTTLAILFFGILSAAAQGTVTISHSSDIDALVNKKQTTKTKEQIKAEKKAAKKAEKEKKKLDKEQQKNKRTVELKPQQANPSATLKQEVKKITVPKISEIQEELPRIKRESTQPMQRTKLVKKRVKHEPVGTQKVTRRVLKGITKTRGFRVQAYTGGNTRAARQEAERIGQQVKMLFPEEPVYVHFYSPRWMCLVGNYTDYEQARKVLRKLQHNGIPKAGIIRMMVTATTSVPIE